MPKRTLCMMAAFGLIMVMTMTTTTPRAVTAQNPSAPAGPEQIVWDLSEIYPTDQAWRAEKDRLDREVEGLSRYEGTLGDGATALRTALDAISVSDKELARLYVYAFLKADEDRRVAEHQERRSVAASLLSEFREITSFVSPELLQVGSETVERYIKEDPGLTKHAFNLRDILRQEPHTLSSEAEQIIAATGPVVQGSERIYAMLSSSDLPFPTITLSGGEEILLNQAAYSLHRASRNRDDRKHVFDSFWTSWKRYEATLGQTLDTQVKAHVFEAKVRKYDSALHAALSGSNIPVDVYHTLIAAAHRHLPSLYRYFRLRERMLDVDDLAYYDIYPSLVASDRTFSLDESKQLAVESAAPLGNAYVDLLRDGLSGDWMHVYPQEGKASGAYMYGAIYDVHPYLLLNHNGVYNDVSTLVHEWGHAVHTLLSQAHNSYETSAYATFTAEIASTTNEVLLQEYMLSKDISDQERLFYLGTALEAVRGTFFRQAMFAEFELKIHEIVEAGEALSGARMTELYEQLIRQYHGYDEGVLTFDPAYAIEWAFIPHFYRNFYVFQYATSIAGGTMFAERFLDGDEKARDHYLGVLSAGGSRYAYELLQEYGIDLASDAPYDALIARMDRVMNEIEQILDRQ